MSWVASGLPNLITNYFIPAVCLDVCVSACACRVYVMRCQTARLLDAFSPLLIWAHLNKFKARGIFIQVFFWQILAEVYFRDFLTFELLFLKQETCAVYEPNKKTQAKDIQVDNLVKNQTKHTQVAPDASLTEYDWAIPRNETRQRCKKTSFNNLDVWCMRWGTHCANQTAGMLQALNFSLWQLQNCELWDWISAA